MHGLESACYFQPYWTFAGVSMLEIRSTSLPGWVSLRRLVCTYLGLKLSCQKYGGGQKMTTQFFRRTDDLFSWRYGEVSTQSVLSSGVRLSGRGHIWSDEPNGIHNGSTPSGCGKYPFVSRVEFACIYVCVPFFVYTVLLTVFIFRTHIGFVTVILPNNLLVLVLRKAEYKFMRYIVGLASLYLT